MILFACALTAAAALLYVFSPGQSIYATHPFAVYALLVAAVVAAWRGRPGMTRIVAVCVILALTAGLFWIHSVRSRTDGGALTVGVGARFPDVTLTTSSGLPFASASLHGHAAALYLFYRGDWCPFCRTELSEIDAYYGEIRAAGVELFAVSVDPPEVSERLRERLGVPFTFLSDPDGALLDALGIRHHKGHGEIDIAYPAQILVDRDGVVRWTFRADSYRQRAHPSEVLAAIAALEERAQ